MALTILGWLPSATLIAVAAVLVFLLAQRLDLGSRLRLSSSGLGQRLRASPRMVIVPAAVFLLVAGAGAVISYSGNAPRASGSGHGASTAIGDMVADLKDYAHSIGGAEDSASKAPPGKLLPDVNTMIERLAARLETAPQDINGWRMLGWSYFNTGRYQQAVAAYAKAAQLDPNSAEIKRAYEEAKAKAADSGTTDTGPAVQSDAAGADGPVPGGKQLAKSDARPKTEYDAAIRAMVDGLAARLESAPRDVEAWTKLMRSRVVLGEREVASSAFRKALEVFKDDAAASSRITAAATELGLKAE